MKIIVHGGADQIGGSCIEIASTTTRIILDCGWPLEQVLTPPPPLAGPKAPAIAWLDEILKIAPPPVPGVFAAGEPANAVLLSHAHPDHTGFIDVMAVKIPIFATTDASKIMKVGGIYARGKAIPRTQFHEAPTPNHWQQPVQPFTIGDLRITAYPVDHSSPGAVGYLVEQAGCRIFYTGDLRFHGRKPGMHQRILKDLRGNLDLLITEGTNVGREQSGLRSEREVENHAVKVSRESASLVMAAYSPQNLDRFVSYYRAAIRAGRIFVSDHYQAAVLYQLHKPALPRPSLDMLPVYLPRKRTVVNAYENSFAEAVISLNEILTAPDRFMMLVRPSMILSDLRGRLPPKSRLLYGMWSGYRQTAIWKQTEEALASADGEVIDCHASGHAHGKDLFAFIEDLAPKEILPVHTRSTLAFQERFGLKCRTSTSFRLGALMVNPKSNYHE